MANLTEVLEYWFGDHPDDAQVIRRYGKLWFGKSEQIDAQIRERFTDLLAAHATGEGSVGSELSARDRLARILLFDQLSRNIYRGQPQSFAYDSQALALCQEGLELGQDQQLRSVERVFFYLPLEHSERLEDQQRSVKLFAELVANVPADWQETFAGFLDYAERHQAIIARFGRFPHRNTILGRQSTPEEQDFLIQPGSSF